MITIYRGVNDKHVYMQLGGYEDNFAYGHRNGILFYEFPLLVEDDKWKMAIKSMNYVRQKGAREDLFLIPNSQCNVSINF